MAVRLYRACTTTYRVFVASCSTNLPSLAVVTPSKYSRMSCGSMKFDGLRFSRLRSNPEKRPRDCLWGCARFAVQPKQYQASFNSGAFWLRGGSRQWRWNELSQPSQQRRNPLVLQAVQKSLLSDWNAGVSDRVWQSAFIMCANQMQPAKSSFA